MSVRFVTLRGTPRQIGLAHGEALRGEIQQCVGIYSLAIGRGEDELRGVAARVERRIRAFAPELADEIEAIAAGAALAPHWLYVLNARSELMARLPDGCTAVFVPSRGLLGKNWDWLAMLEPLVAILHIERPDGLRLATLTEPGMVGKIGCNSAGLGVCLNFVYAPGALDGVPVHVLLRELLQQVDLAAARRRLDAAGDGRAGNVLVGSAADGGVDVVFLGGRRVVTELAADAFAHTNHVGDDRSTGGPMYDNSVARLRRATALCGAVAGPAELLALLADRHDAVDPICVPYRPYPPVPQVDVGTVATVAMDLAARRLYVRRGPDPAGAVAVLDVAGALSAGPGPAAPLPPAAR